MRPTLFGLIVLLCTACTASVAKSDPAPATTTSNPPAAQATGQPKAQANTAPPAATMPAPDAVTDAPPPQLYRWATDHLISGLWYERAIAQLKAGLDKDPQNMQYHLALGCAEADRAASIGYALTWRGTLTAMQGVYPMEIDMWEKGQKDPKNPEYGMPKPQPPPKFDVWTKDDYKQIKMTDAEANARIAELSKAAKDEWTQAIALCKTPQDKAMAEYVQGWGLRLLSRQGGGAFPMAAEMAQMFGMASNSDALKSLEAATKDDPGTAVYWQSVGDALYNDPEFADLISTFMPTGTPTPADAKPGDITALDAYRQSLKIDSGNPMLLYRVSLLEAKDDPKQALADLKLAASGDPANSYMAYQAASWEFKQSKFAGAFNLLDIIKTATQSAEKSQVTSSPSPASPPSDTSTGNDQISVQVSGVIPGSTDSTPATTADGAPSFPDAAEVAKKGAEAYQDEDSRNLAMEAVALIEQGNSASTYHTPIYLPAVPKMMAVAWGYGNQMNIDPGGALDTMQMAMGACQFAEAAGQAGDVDDATRAARAVISMGLKMLNGSMAGSKDITGLGMGTGIAAMGYDALEKIYQATGDQDMASQVKAESDAFQNQMKSSVMQQMQNWMQSFFGNY
jgi:tetratricopeptide (TPR) repeat protein